MKRKLGEILVTTGAVSDADVDAALQEQSAGEPSRLGDLLVATGKLTAVQLAQALAEQYQLPYVELPPLPQAVLDLVPMELQRQYRFVPLKSEGTELFIAMADLANLEVVATLEQQWTKVHVHVTSGDEIDALHATLSGLFAAPAESSGEAPPAGGTDDLFGSFELEGEPASSPAPAPAADPLFSSFELDADPEPSSVDLYPPPVLAVSPSQVMAIASAVIASPLPQAASSTPSPLPAIAPVVARVPPPPVAAAAPPATSTSSPQLAEDLFGDLNLESVRTGITARPPEAAPAPTSVGTLLEPAPPPEVEPEPEPEPEPLPDVEPASAAIATELNQVPESSGPVLTGEVVVGGSAALPAEGTGPLLDLLAREGTGPVVDTPFFTGASAGEPVPPMSDAPFVSSRSSLSAPALQPTPVPQPAPAPEEDLPEWLKSGPVPAAPVAPAPPPAAPAAQWTGALDHLMPSRLVVGLTRALLARGLVTEEEILAALGQKK